MARLVELETADAGPRPDLELTDGAAMAKPTKQFVELYKMPPCLVRELFSYHPLLWSIIFIMTPTYYIKPLNWIATTNRDPSIFKMPPKYYSKPPNLGTSPFPSPRRRSSLVAANDSCSSLSNPLLPVPLPISIAAAAPRAAPPIPNAAASLRLTKLSPRLESKRAV